MCMRLWHASLHMWGVSCLDLLEQRVWWGGGAGVWISIAHACILRTSMCPGVARVTTKAKARAKSTPRKTMEEKPRSGPTVLYTWLNIIVMLHVWILHTHTYIYEVMHIDLICVWRYIYICSDHTHANICIYIFPQTYIYIYIYIYSIYIIIWGHGQLKQSEQNMRSCTLTS